MAPTPNKRVTKQQDAAPVKIKGSARAKPLSVGKLIDSTLQSLNEDQLRDVIRVAQRALKARVEERRSVQHAQKKTKRFWDRPLSMDWSEGGVPKIPFPGQRASRSGSQDFDVFELLGGPAWESDPVDWSVFELLRNVAREPAQLDWSVFEMLSPVEKGGPVDWNVFSMLSLKRKAQKDHIAMFNAEDVDEFVPEFDSVFDWSASRLPCGTWRSPAGGRRRRHHINPRYNHRPSGSADSLDVGTPTALGLRQAVPVAKMPRVPTIACRSAPSRRMRIQQPTGVH